MGPPIVAPNWLNLIGRRRGDVEELSGVQVVVSQKLVRASVQLVGPDLTTMSTCAPEYRPMDAEYWPVWTLTSCNASSEGTKVLPLT